MSQFNPSLTANIILDKTHTSDISTTPHRAMEFTSLMDSVSRMLGGLNHSARVRTGPGETVYRTRSRSAERYSFLRLDPNVNGNHVANSYPSGAAYVDEILAAPVPVLARHLSSSRNAHGSVYSYPEGEGIPSPLGEAVHPSLSEKESREKSNYRGSPLKQNVQEKLYTCPASREAYPPRAVGPCAPGLSGRGSRNRTSVDFGKRGDARKKKSQREPTPAERRILEKYAHTVRVRLARHAAPVAVDAIPTPNGLKPTAAFASQGVTYTDNSLPPRPASAPPFIPTVLHRPSDRSVEPLCKAAEMEFHHEGPTTSHMSRVVQDEPATRMDANRPSPLGQHTTFTDETHAHYDVTPQPHDDGESAVMGATPASQPVTENATRYERSRGVSPESRIPTPAVPDAMMLTAAGVFFPATGETVVPARNLVAPAAAHTTFANVRSLESPPFPSEKVADRCPKQAVVDLGALAGTRLLTATARPFISVVRKGDAFRLSVMIREAGASSLSGRRIPAVFAPYGERDMHAYDVFIRKSTMAGLEPYGPHGPMRQSQDFLVEKGRELCVAVRFPKNNKIRVGMIWIDLETEGGWRGYVEH